MLRGAASPFSRPDGAGAAVSAGAPSDAAGRSDCNCCAPHALSTQGLLHFGTCTCRQPNCQQMYILTYICRQLGLPAIPHHNSQK